MHLNIKITRIPTIRGAMPPIPSYATPGAAAVDLFANIDDSMTIAAGETAIIPSGIAIGIPADNYVGLIFVRSGVAVSKGLSLANGAGVIDSDYTGEIKIVVRNLSSSPATINPLERVAQLMIVPNTRIVFDEVDALDATARGGGGFGSTGQ